MAHIDRTIWGWKIGGRQPAKDDGDWKAFHHADEERIMWYNVTTHEHKWELPPPNEIVTLVRELSVRCELALPIRSLPRTDALRSFTLSLPPTL